MSTTITLHLWDEGGRPAGSVECDLLGPLPARSTPTAPPAGDVRWIGGAWVPAPAPDLAALQAELRERATALRWQHETGGIVVAGTSVATGIDDQNRINTVLTAERIAGIAVVDFKAASGWVQLPIDQIEAIAAAIAVHVQACFSAERAHHEAIDALVDVAAAEAYDVAAGWPEPA